MTKTKKCNWCCKRKLTKDMYHIGVMKNLRKIKKVKGVLKVYDDETDYWICNEFNLKEDII